MEVVWGVVKTNIVNYKGVKMKKLQEAAKRFLKEEKYNLIMLADQCDQYPELRRAAGFTATYLLLAITTLAQGGTAWTTERLHDSMSFNDTILGYEFEFRTGGRGYNATSTIKKMLSEEGIENKIFPSFSNIHSVNIEKKIEIQKKLKFYIDRIKKDILPHLPKGDYENYSQVVFTEYPPCVDIFLKIYRQGRDKEFFKSTGLYSRFFRGEYQEMHLRIGSSEFLTFEKVLEYGVKYPKSRTAKILQKYFKIYWEEANDKLLKDNLSQKNNPNVLDAVIIKDLQPIVKGYLFGS